MKRLLISALLFTSSCICIAQPPIFSSIDIVPGTGSSTPQVLAELNGKILLTAYTPAYGRELWITDSAHNNATLVKDINPGTQGLATIYAGWGFTIFNSKLYFTANDGINGEELWATDGTETGTQMVKDINPGSASAFTQSNWIGVSAGKLYFTANNGTNGYELWVSDGTTAGTVLLKDIETGSGSSIPNQFTELNGNTIFSATTSNNGAELWITDGTSAGTQMLMEIYPGTTGSEPREFIALNNKLFFVAASNNYGSEIWQTDGTSAGTAILKDINPSGDGVKSYAYITEMANKLYFDADDGTHGRELWVTDGTTSGTQMVMDANPGSDGADIANITQCNGKLFFFAYLTSTGMEPWVSDGTATGTHLLKDLTGDYANGAVYTTFTHCKRYTYFLGQKTYGFWEMWQTDGTSANTKTVAPDNVSVAKPLNNTFGLTYIASDSSLYFFANYNDIGCELWRLTDNTMFPINIPQSGVKSNNMYLFPNPAHNSFTIKTTATFRQGNVTLTDVTGRVVKTEKLTNNTQTIFIDGIVPGIYIADIWLDDKRSTQKLNIE